MAPVLWADTGSPAGEAARSEYLAQTWDTDRGLPDYGVTSFAQSGDGYLWAATYEGLVRFDGARFELINHSTTPEFPGRATSVVMVDRQGRIWAGTDQGLACLRSGRWHTYTKAGGTPILYPPFLVEDRNGLIVTLSEKRLLQLVQDRFEEMPAPLGAGLPTLFPGQSGDLWAYDENSITHLLEAGWQRVALSPEILRSGIYGAGASRGGGVWVAGATIIQKCRDGVWSERRQTPAGFRFTREATLLEDSEGNLWAGDNMAGLLVFRHDGRVLRFSRDDGLSNLAIRALFEDREKNIWVGTHGGGMIRLRPRAAHLFAEESGLGEIMLNTVAEKARGGLLVATYGGGLVEFDASRLRFVPPTGNPGLKQLEGTSRVNSALEDKSGTVWAGVGGKGLFRIGAGGFELTPGRELPGSPRALFQDSQGTLWMGTDNGAASYRSGRLTTYDSKAGLSEGAVVAVAEDREGQIWAGGTAGLFRYRDGRFEKFQPAAGNELGAITSLHGGAHGLWIGVDRGGLYRLRNTSLTSYGVAQGFPQARVTGIVADDSGRLWMATFRDGVLCVSVDSFDAVDAHRSSRLQIQRLKREDGLATNQFRSGYQPTAWKGRDGRLWFATLKGLAMVDPKRVPQDHMLAAPVIEAVGVNGQKEVTAGNREEVLVLPAGSKRLQFFYTAPSFTAPENIRFQYQLDGLDPSWFDTNERSTVFGEISPGDYVFRVRVVNDSGSGSPAPAVLRIRVASFIWETWWFRLLALASTAALGAMAVYGRQRKKLLRRTVQLRREQGLRRNVERLQTVVKASEERFIKAFNASPNPLSIATLDEGRFVDVNESFLRAAGLARSAVLGRTDAELKIWEGTPLSERVRAAIERGEPARGLDARMRGKSGQLRHLTVSAEVIELGGVRHLLASSDDITERELLERQLAQLRKMESIGRLAGGVAHDFNNLLTIINGYSDLLIRAETREKSLERLREIRQAGERARELTAQLLAFSRHQAIVPRVVNLNVVVAETERMLRHLLPETIRMVTRLDSDLGSIHVDPGQMHQVLLNLALNARDAMPDGGQLVLETGNAVLTANDCATDPDSSPGPCVLLAVTDTGTGIDESVREHIFEPFFTTKEPGSGTGLGLASVYGIVRQSAGWIRVESELGKGTTFKIFFPRHNFTEPEELASTPMARLSEGKETILLVEDRDDVRTLARVVLESGGYRVLEAPNGSTALDLAGQHSAPIHLLLTDVVMPGMSGRNLHAHLTKERGPIRVIYMSGYTEDVIAHQANLKAGAAFLQKPMTPEELLAKVRETLNGPVGL